MQFMLWLWHRLAVVALIQPLAWELPYATGAAVKKRERKIFLKKKLKKINVHLICFQICNSQHISIA